MQLLLTLGHNSSAIGCNENGTHTVGYEQERFDKIKSSSHFPECMHEVQLNWSDYDDREAFVTHWFDDFNFHKGSHPKIMGKYWTHPYTLNQQSLKSEKFGTVHHLSPELTHHDAHAWSVVDFFEAHADKDELASIDDYQIAVADGFGNQQEVFSLYTIADGKPKLRGRTYGYAYSLGLMYQFATSFVGMKENEDEYKFLGYESHISAEQDNLLRNKSSLGTVIDSLVERIGKGSPRECEYIDLGELAAVKSMWHKRFDQILCDMVPVVGVKLPADSWLARVIIGRFIQLVIENFYAALIKRAGIKKVMVAGGLHYNVKLNNSICKQVEKFCVMPLAGDQGCAIGLRRAHGYTGFEYRGLCLGKRDLSMAKQPPTNNIVYCDNRDEYVETVARLVNENKLVNVMCGDMEFGPRALCNTSTLALPSMKNVELINGMNGRNTVMPFAGVMQPPSVGFFHDTNEADKVIGSLHYMITTLDYTPKTAGFEKYRGVQHSYPGGEGFSGRPQVAFTHRPIHDILNKTSSKVIINTSFNVHGTPICFSLNDALVNHHAACVEAARDEQNMPVLVIGNF